MSKLLDMFKVLSDRPSVGPMGTGLMNVATGGMGSQGGKSAQLNAMDAAGVLFASIDLIATSMSALEWQLFRVAANGERTEVFQHPWLDLWASPSPFHTQEEFQEASTQHGELTGEQIWAILRPENSKLPQEMWLLRPDWTNPIPDRDEFVKGYIYRAPGAEPLVVPAEDVIFTRRPHPTSAYRGLSALQSIMTDLEVERQAIKWSSNFFKNGARPGGMLEFENGLNDIEYEKLVRRWKDFHQGPQNANRVGIIEKGKWTDVKMTQRDMQLEQLRRFNQDIIMTALRISPHMLGKEESVNRATAEAAEVTFNRNVIRPRARRLRAVLNRRLILPSYGPGLYFDFIDPTPDDQELAIRRADSGIKGKYITINEARELNGFGEIEGGDELPTTPEPAPLPPGEEDGEEDELEGAFVLPVTSKARLALKSGPERLLTPAQAKVRDKINAAWAKRLATEADDIVEFLEQFKGFTPLVVKIEPTDMGGYNWDWWAKYGDDVLAELKESYLVMTSEVVADLPGETIQIMAGQWAEQRGAQLLRLDGDINMVKLTQARVNDLVSQTIQNGQSLGQLQRTLRTDFAFSKERATVVARTETATALGQGSKQIAVAEGRDEKMWISQGDDVVSDECLRNEAAGWIKTSEVFPSGVDTIPQHPNCRCNTRYRTAEVSTIGASIHEFRCPDCDHLLDRDVPTGQSRYCRTCKVARVAQPVLIAT